MLSRFETSAKENRNVDEACGFLIQKILEHDTNIPEEVRPVAPNVCFLVCWVFVGHFWH